MSLPGSGRGDTTFGKYQLIANLGHGGMADVYLAVAHGPAGFNKLVVIKRLRPNLAEEPEFLAMFLDEARLAARLNHPNVVQTNEVGEVAGSYFIAMEYLDGQPLNRIMHRAVRQGLAVPMQLYLKVLCDSLAGLHHAHELTDFDGSALNVVHRDASPHNIFVTYDGQTKLVDFGIAKAASRTAETRAGVLKGKIAYMAPEQARCAPHVDRRADVFSIGVLLWELLTGQRLWKGLADVEVLERLMLADIPRPRTVVPDIPEELEAMCVRALALKPEDRYPTASEFRDELERYADKNLPRVASKDLGSLVLELFADRRRELKSIVEQQLRGMSIGGGGGGDVRIDILDIPTFAAMTPLGGIPRLSSGGIPQEGTPANVATPTYNSAALSASMLPPPRRRGAVLALGGAAGVGGLMALLLLMRSTPEPAPADGTISQASSPATPAAPATAPEPKTMELRVTARPAGAKISLDEVVLGQGSFAGRFPADGSSRLIKIEAPGHAPQSQTATFDKDVALDIALEPEKTTKVTQAGARPPPVAPVATPSPLPNRPGPGKPPKRKLDSNDPWANGK